MLNETTMIIPAIDISNGNCVRLIQGQLASKREYTADPVELVKEYRGYGAKLLHVVDLDASMNRGTNRALIQKMVAADIDIEVGGGIRTEEDVQQLLDIGIQRLVLGSVLLQDFPKVLSWIEKYGNIFVASLDLKDGKIQIEGWEQESKMNYGDFIENINKSSFLALNLTDVSSDGTLRGISMDFMNDIAKRVAIPVSIGGGIGSAAHIDEVMEKGDKNIKGLVIGRAIYENRISIQDILKKYPPKGRTI